MMTSVTALIIPAFIAGLLTFLAPCTLPLVPGYLGFISGVSADELQENTAARRKVLLNGVLYVLGFSAVFIVMGSLIGLGGAAFAQYRTLLGRIGGVFVIFFGLYMVSTVLNISAFNLDFLRSEHRFNVASRLKPGRPVSSLVFGATFAFGWTPCVGPVLGSVLALAASSATVGQGAFLLAIFSLGLGVPFLLIAASFDSASERIAKIAPYLKVVSMIGGVFLVLLGVLLVTNNFNAWLSFVYSKLSFLNYDRLLDYL